MESRPHDAALPASVIKLNLGFLFTARQLVIGRSPVDARVLLGVREPLLSWLREADAMTLCNLAASPALVYAVRVPAAAGQRLLSACQGGDDARWLAAMHLALSSTEDADGPAR